MPFFTSGQWRREGLAFDVRILVGVIERASDSSTGVSKGGH